MKKKILLIGGAGYLGRVISEDFIKKKYSVRVLDNCIYHNVKNEFNLKNSNFEFVHGDKSDLKILKNVLNNVDIVILLSGLVGDPITKKYPILSNKTNIDKTKKCINFINKFKIKKLIFVSTCSNYGVTKKQIPVSENNILNPISAYSKAKVKIENFLIKNKKKLNFPFTILRFSTAFGYSPRMRFDLTVNQFVKDIYMGKKIELYDADTWRPYCHVKDFANAIHRVIQADEKLTKNNIFNVGRNENNFSKLSIIKLIIKKMKKGSYEIVKNSKDRRNYVVNFSKIKKILKFTPKLSISYGIGEIIQQLKKENIKKSELNQLGNYKIKRKFL
jgi:nucleoside-diphosphate-sugar epimerase|tara:strand:- start:2099 stop:3094 length:996 start_codon:yes stop_codon:yes gene_type:complete